MPEHQQTQQSKESKLTFQKKPTPITQTPISNPMVIIQRARINPKSLTHADVMQLQRTIGNRAVGKLLSGIESSFKAQQATVQRQEISEEETCSSCIQRQEIPEEEEPLQGKMAETVQRQEILEEEEPLQGKMTDTIQRQGIPEEEKLLQGKMIETVQCQEIPEEEELLQGKMSETIQRQKITEEEEPFQTKRENNTGMPDNLKAGIENLSGINMNDVRVNINSDKPAEVGALAYTQGTNIYVAPGQEKHLPHEAWHVVQQKQGRVKPTIQTRGMNINDNPHLEKEADAMGSKALQQISRESLIQPLSQQHSTFPTGIFPIQMKLETKEDMEPKLKNAIVFLNEVEDGCYPISPLIVKVIRESLKILKESTYGESNGYHDKIADFIQSIESKLELPPEDVPEDLKHKNIHSIWVQGEYERDEELLEAMKTRKNSGGTWLNLIWVYEKAKTIDPNEFQTINGMKVRPINIGGLEMDEVDFKATMASWKNKPEWVNSFLKILDILLEKKSFVAMSDIMRMIILYYQGGLYMDVKVQIETPMAKFFDQPMVNVNKLQMVKSPFIENWAMIASAGCKMIEEIMLTTLKSITPMIEILKRLPENYAVNNRYSGAHAEVHESYGPWRTLESYKGKVDIIREVNPGLELQNPRPVNSWADHDNTHLAFESLIPGFTIVPVEDDGNCLFSAVAIGAGKSAKILRIMVAHTIKIDQDLRENLYGSDRDRKEAINNRLRDMANADKQIVWGGDEEIKVLSVILNKPIVLHRPNLLRQKFQRTDTEILDFGKTLPPNSIHIYQPYGQHFDGMSSNR